MPIKIIVQIKYLKKLALNMHLNKYNEFLLKLRNARQLRLFFQSSPTAESDKRNSFFFLLLPES